MTDTKSKHWDDEAVSTLLSTVGDASPISAASVEAAAQALGRSVRSVASKLRQLDKEVVSMATVKVSTFTTDEGAELRSFVESNAGQLTYKDIADKFAGGKFSAKQVQGKLLALELTGSVKPTEKVEAVRTYSKAEEAVFIKMANSGKFIEEIATTLGREVPSIRGKALSLIRTGDITAIPAQKESHAKTTVDPVATLGESIVTMTVDEIAKAVDKTSRGIKTLLTRRGIDVADYKGSQKKEKAEAKAEAKAGA